MNSQNSVNRALTVQQHALWLLAHCSPRDVRYNIGLAMQVHGEFDVVAFELAIHRLVARTTVLRSTFPGTNGTPYLVIKNHIER